MRAATMFLVLTVAGCLTTGPAKTPVTTVPDVSWAEKALPFGEGHDHFKYSDHQNLSTPNFHIVGHDPLISPTFGRTTGGHHCGDAQQTTGGKRLAAVEDRYVGGFSIADVTDAAHPKFLGEFVMRTTRVYDLAVVPDGNYVLLVTLAQPTPSVPGLDTRDTGIDWVRACNPEERVPLLSATEDPIARPSSLILVDIRDPANPQVVDQRPIPTDGHSVFSTIIDGRTWVLVSVFGTPGGYYQFYELVSTPAGSRLNFLSTFNLKQSSQTQPQFMEVHDGWIAKHPITKKVLAYLAGGADVFILDLSTPQNPTVLGHWTDLTTPPKPYQGSLHSIVPIQDVWDGHHYTVVGPEFGARPGDHPSGTVWILDTTDPSKPFEVAAWTLPYQVEWTGVYMFSNHYVGVSGHTLFASMYHGGVWAIDLSNLTQKFSLLPSIGVFLPDQPSPKPPTKLERWTPVLQEVLPLPDGTLVTFDGAAGIYTVTFDATKPMPAPPPWPIEPVTKR